MPVKYGDGDDLFDGILENSRRNIEKSKGLILDRVMKKYNITEKNLRDPQLVESKLREFTIDEILK